MKKGVSHNDYELVCKDRIYAFVKQFSYWTASEIGKGCNISHVYADKLASKMSNIKYKENKRIKKRGMRMFYV